ncbi:Os05g0339300, partial [Oryza sativa Japonica Group]
RKKGIHFRLRADLTSGSCLHCWFHQNWMNEVTTLLSLLICFNNFGLEIMCDGARRSRDAKHAMVTKAIYLYFNCANEAIMGAQFNRATEAVENLH